MNDPETRARVQARDKWQSMMQGIQYKDPLLAVSGDMMVFEGQQSACRIESGGQITNIENVMG